MSDQKGPVVVGVDIGIIDPGIQAVGDLPVIGDAIGIPVHADRTVEGAFARGIDIFQLVVIGHAVGDRQIQVGGIGGDGRGQKRVWAAWCGACSTFAPVLEKVAARHAGHVFAKLELGSRAELTRVVTEDELTTG